MFCYSYYHVAKLIVLQQLYKLSNCGDTYLWLGCSCWVPYGWDWSFYEGQCRGKASFVLTLLTEAVQCEVVSTHKQSYTNHSQHIVVDDRCWIWTAYRSLILPVDGLQRQRRTHSLSSFWELVGSGRTRWLWTCFEFSQQHLTPLFLDHIGCL